MEAGSPRVNGEIGALLAGLWPRYLAAMRKAGVPVRKMQWYERWVGRFAAFRQDSPLAARTYADVRAFIDHVCASGQSANWQVVQADHALLLLYRDVVVAPWIAQWRPFEASAEPPLCPVPVTGSDKGCSFRDHASQAN